MFWEMFSLSNLADHAAEMRRRHSAWLTRAMRRPSRYPRIPTRRVSDGGFSAVVATPTGREWADQWWAETLQMEELDL
jgi:hypothetical protein